MGHVILPTGSTVWIDELQGSINLSQLVTDMKSEEYTVPYRISIISAISKLGKNALGVIPYLKELSANKNATGNEKLLCEASEQAIKKIEEGGSVGTTSTWRDGANGRQVGPPGSHANGRQVGSSGTNYMGWGKRPEPQKVTFTELEVSDNLHEGLKHYCRCNFCEKMAAVNGNIRRFSDRLAGSNKFYCNFCIRNDYYLRCSDNVMVLTYRGLIGYYYYSYYVAPKTPSMYLIDIQDYVELHIKAGIQNPLFRYDPETFNWFVDFGKVGKTKRKMAVESVLQTITEQLACFNLYENVRDSSPRKLYEKYRGAVLEFYQQRARNNGRVFAPTLWGCDIPNHCPAGARAISMDLLQEFTPMNLADQSYANRTSARRW